MFDRRWIVLVALGALLGAGCGSGGGGGASTGDAFGGSWHYAGYLGELVPPDPATVTCDFGRTDADGSGTLALTHRQSANNTVSGPATDQGLAYALAPDHALTWTLSPTATQPALGGVLSGDGRLALLSAITVGSVPSVRVLVRREGTFSDASLSGAYHTVDLSFFAPSDAGFVGTTTFDGAGLLNASGTTNREGLHLPALSAGSYTVTAQGDLAITSPTLTLEGGILAGGDVAVVGGGTSTGESTVMRAYVREAASASLLTFAGIYHVVLFATTDILYGTYAGDLEADGAGGWTAEFTIKTIGELTDASPSLESGSYTVGPDGAFGISFGAAPTPYEGGVSPDGAFAVAGGPLTGSSDPALWVLVRR